VAETDPPLDSTIDLTHWTDAFALLSDPGRLNLLLHLRDEGPMTVTALAANTRRTPTAISQSLRILRAHHVVSARRTGRHVSYALREHAVTDLLRELPGLQSPVQT
jgi:ArsR family transcriptional regulator, lead/cadmium/zinc/bismuth-responsive transcriptional repressor